MPDTGATVITRPISTAKQNAQPAPEPEQKKKFVEPATGVEISDWEGMEGEQDEVEEKPEEKRTAKTEEAEEPAPEETGEMQEEASGPPPWLRALFQEAEQQRPMPTQQQPQTQQPTQQQREDTISLMDQFINDPKAFESRVAQIGRDAASREFQQLRDQLNRERMSRATRAYQENIGKAMQNFSEIEKTPEYKNKRYADAINGFYYQLAQYAQAQIMYASQNGMDADVSYLSDPMFLEFGKLMAAKQAGVQPSVTKVNYGTSEKAKAPTRAPQRKPAHKRSEDEERMRVRLGLTEEQWEENEREGEELGL